VAFPGPGHGNTLTRVLSALVLAPIALAAAWFGDWLFAAFWTVAAVAVLYEWTSIVLAARDLGGRPRAGWIAAGLVYALLMAWSPILLRGDIQYGFVVIVFLFAVVWTTDILGYFGGRALGGPKLAASISPSKTWSGAIAGTAGAGVASAIAAVWIGGTPWPQLVAIGIAVSVAAQIGDLGESAFKRRFHTKDASQLIPGHGGVMDRLDGFWAAALFAVMVGVARGGFLNPGGGLLVW
jgi:phosphatidate cytidylyltransferase